MRILYPLIFLSLFFAPLSLRAQQNHAGTYVAVEIMNFSTGKLLPVLNNACTEQQGISIYAYCESHQLVIFRIDFDQHGEERLAQMLRALHLEFVQKPAGINNDIMQHCGNDYHRVKEHQE